MTATNTLTCVCSPLRRGLLPWNRSTSRAEAVGGGRAPHVPRDRRRRRRFAHSLCAISKMCADVQSPPSSARTEASSDKPVSHTRPKKQVFNALYFDRSASASYTTKQILCALDFEAISIGVCLPGIRASVRTKSLTRCYLTTVPACLLSDELGEPRSVPRLQRSSPSSATPLAALDMGVSFSLVGSYLLALDHSLRADERGK